VFEGVQAVSTWGVKYNVTRGVDLKIQAESFFRKIYISSPVRSPSDNNNDRIKNGGLDLKGGRGSCSRQDDEIVL